MLHLPQSFLQDPDLSTFARSVGPCTLFKEGNSSLAASQFREPYEALAHAIVGQHLHSNAVRTIFERFCRLNTTGQTGTHPPAAETLLTITHEALKECGLSDSKIHALKELAKAQSDGQIPTSEQAETLDDETLIAQLTSLYGIGRWTVEMFLIFGLHRPDVFPADDFGIREGWRRIKKLPEKPSPRELYKTTEKFSPHRTLLTCYCWHAKEELAPPEEQSK
ncbi:DNA-3-methyladenine glycosylase 2 family protein [Acetobacteraceae bacterium ESL0709]|nr:DNA-3-methyladenine glycosylase 2 family protein [Acetobacteraceae bacterium ESL0697]MDF7678994.1 DNA-3-methyladenine glycosylase 2 family protein [Acetobacteraceae bacterium ESL0709]